MFCAATLNQTLGRHGDGGIGEVGDDDSGCGTADSCLAGLFISTFRGCKNGSPGMFVVWISASRLCSLQSCLHRVLSCNQPAVPQT